MKVIRKSYEIHALIERVWKALVNPAEIDNWGAGPAKMDDKVGTRFELWGGDIHGGNVEVVKNKKLVQDWYSGNWQEASKLIINLRSSAGKTKVDLLHTNVPDSESDEINDGWDQYYFEPMKEYLENN